jgi:hypothetical protein
MVVQSVVKLLNYIPMTSQIVLLYLEVITINLDETLIFTLTLLRELWYLEFMLTNIKELFGANFSSTL